MKKKFTLIELLVVVPILVILAAMLLPGLARAKYKAKVAACKSNLRGIVLSATTYAADYDWWYPQRGGAVRNDIYSMRATGNIDVRDADNNLTGSRTNNTYWDIKTPWKPYYQDFDIFTCPLIPHEEQVSRRKSGSNDSTYALFMDTYGGVSQGGAIARGPDRVVQYTVEGNLIADSKSWSASQTWNWPYLDTKKLLLRTTDNWVLTQTNPDQPYSLFARDVGWIMTGGTSHPLQANHPDPAYAWTQSSWYWSAPRTLGNVADANYADKDGSVRNFPFYGPAGYSTDGFNSQVGFLPDYYKK